MISALELLFVMVWEENSPYKPDLPKSLYRSVSPIILGNE